MTDEQHESGPNLEHYSGDGEDLTQEQREYLHAYALHEVGEDSSPAEVAAGALSESAEGEWA